MMDAGPRLSVELGEAVTALPVKLGVAVLAPLDKFVVASSVPLGELAVAVSAPLVKLVATVLTPLVKPSDAVIAPLTEPSGAVMAPLIEPSDAITGSTVATIDSLAGTELTMKLDSYADSEARPEAVPDTGAAVVSEPEEVKVASPSPSELVGCDRMPVVCDRMPVVCDRVPVVCDRMPVETAEVAGAVPATPGKVIPEAILVGIAEATVLSAEAYEAKDAPDKVWSSEVPEGVVAAVPTAPDRDIPNSSVVVAADDIVFSADESEVVGVDVNVDSRADCMPVDVVVSKGVPVETAKVAVPGPV
jgi:hypothetical protein